MDNELEYHLDNAKDIPEINNKRFSKRKIIRLIIIISIIVIIALALILYFCLSGNDQKNDNEDKKDESQKPNPIPIENSNITFIPNISYVNTNIVNSFKKDGENYLPNLGEINNGEDYEKNEQNMYDIYFPDKNSINISKPIILMIHGGAWTDFTKDIVADFCKILAENGYISATMGYTLLGQKGTKYNIFKTIDEINCAISSIKNVLKNLDFNEKELKIVIAGESSGAHQALLYSYMNKKQPEIPIKFTINFFAPVTLESQYYYKLVGEPFENIDPETIAEAEKNKTIVELNTKLINPSSLVNYMNLFLGSLYSDDELKKMIKDNKTDTENEGYIELLNKAKYGFPVNYITKNSLPTINLYGGRDDIIGIKHYAYLKSRFEEEGHYNNVLIYGKDFNHVYFFYQDKDTFNKLLFQIENFTNLYMN